MAHPTYPARGGSSPGQSYDAFRVSDRGKVKPARITFDVQTRSDGHPYYNVTTLVDHGDTLRKPGYPEIELMFLQLPNAEARRLAQDILAELTAQGA